MSADIDRNDVLTAMRGIDLLKDVPMDAIKLERLGGLTNRNYRIDSPHGRHVLRIPGAGTSEYISRKNEAHAARSAAKVGVNAEVVHFDETTGVMLCRFIDGGVTMNAERFKDLGSVKRSAMALKRVHDNAAPFLNRFELFQMVDEYLDILAKKNAPLPDGYHDVKREAEAVRAALNARPLPIKPCHCDPLAENFLDTGEPRACDRLGICRQQRSDVGPRRRLGRGRLRPGPGRGAAGGLFRRQGAGRRPRPDGALQGDVRSAVDAVGHHPAREPESGG